MASAPIVAPGATLVERGAELEVLQDALERVPSGAGELVFVAGEAGVGKTSLLRRFADESGVEWMGRSHYQHPVSIGPGRETE